MPGARARRPDALAFALDRRAVLLVLAGLVPVVSGLRRGFPLPGLRLSEVLIAGLATLVLVGVERRRAVPWRARDWWALAYVGATLAIGVGNLLHRQAPLTVADLSTLLGPLQFLLLYRAIAVAADGDRMRRWAVRTILLASLPVSALAVVQNFVPAVQRLVASITGVDFLATQAAGTFRVTGPFPLWHNLGGYLLIVCLLCIGLLLRPVPGVLARRWTIAVLVAALVALVLARSLAPMAGLVVGTAMMGVSLRRFGRVALGGGAVLAVVAVAFGPVVGARLSQQFDAPVGSDRPAWLPQTLEYRYEHWTQTQIPVLSGRWTFGYGPDQPPELRDFPYNESLYFSLLLRGGLVLLAVFLALMWALWRSGVAAARSGDPLQAVLGRVVATAVALFLVLDLIEAYLVGSGTSQLLWACVGLLAAPAAAVSRAGPPRAADGRRRWPLVVAPRAAGGEPAAAAPAGRPARRPAVR
jgi:hypothetical protein